MGNTLYLECYSGISGDMTVATLLDLGADESVLRKVLSSMNIEGYSIDISRVSKAGIDACDFDVILDKEHENHDHDMEYLHGEEHHHSHEEHHHSSEEHTHSHSEHHHSHEHRGLEDVMAIIDSGDMTDRARQIAKDIFMVLAKAESKAHGVDISEIHFHEVGAVDSIVDIVSVAVCIDNLDIDKVIVPELYEGTGSIRCQHGIIPVPVPAVLHIVTDNNISLHITGTKGELVTPTGAAIVAALKTSDKLPDTFHIENIGVGAGKRNYDRPSMLRGMLITSDEDKKDYVYKLETNIDDATGENLGYVMDKLLEEGARDVHYLPVFMKKNRPAYELVVICKEEDITRLENIIFSETTTIGIRKIKMERSVLPREIKEIDTTMGRAAVKVCCVGDKKKVYPEYSSVVKLCRENDISFTKAYTLIQSEYDK